MSDMSDAYREMLLEKLAALEKERDELARQVEGMHEALNQRTKDMKDAEDERDVARAMLEERTTLLAGARERESVHEAAIQQALRERDWHQAASRRHATERDEYAARVVTLERQAKETTAALLEEHRKALVRARNEGLEKAAAWAEAIGAQGLTPSALAVSASIRAMKAPESD